MPSRSFRPSRRGTHRPTDVDALIREATTAARARQQGYRERSLELHGWICPDGSNWENLCVDCHEDEHTRGVLGDYLTGKD
ncbi:MAG: HNH endonuclease [Deltaproteobacteria bacterium]|nr:MAG: HNH endonuclease [Deltaproteobacteria bacterium]